MTNSHNWDPVTVTSLLALRIERVSLLTDTDPFIYSVFSSSSPISHPQEGEEEEEEEGIRLGAVVSNCPCRWPTFPFAPETDTSNLH